MADSPTHGAVDVGELAATAAAAAAGDEQQQQRLTEIFETYLQQHMHSHLARQEAQHRASDAVRPRLPKPDAYKGGPHVDEWIFIIDNYLTASGVELDIERITIATIYLRGPALVWWRRIDSNPNDRPTSWSSFCAGLRATFQPTNPAEDARDKLARLRQTGSVAAYATIMRNTALDIPTMTDDELKDRFIRGLRTATQNECRMRTPATFEAAVQVAERYDALRNISTWRKEPISSFYSGGDSGPSAMELGAAVDFRTHLPTPRTPSPNGGSRQFRQKLTPELQQMLIKEGKCFFCRQPGHMALNCPERLRQQRAGK